MNFNTSDGRDLYSIISNLKCKEVEASKSLQIPITTENTETVGYLLPVGDWILSDIATIRLMSEWRQREMKYFLIHFDSTPEKTEKYLLEFSLNQNDRLLFLITDLDGRVLGHLGLANIDRGGVELDNLMRGLSGGPKNLMELAENSLINFVNSRLGVHKISLRVMSFNFLAIQIHQNLNFLISDTLFLKKVQRGETIAHEVVDSVDSNVPYKCLVMEKIIQGN